MRTQTVRSFLAALAVVGALSAGVAGTSSVANAAEIRYVVNGMAVTSYDIERRAAFLRVQHKSGNLREQAADDMVEQALKRQEMKRLQIDVSNAEVDGAFERFAKSNKLTSQQLSKALSQAGVTTEHFKEYVRTQIGWSRALQARFQATERMTEQDAVQKMLQQGGAKPKAKEYLLQQVIFVIPAGKKSALLGKRQREAQAMRQRFRDCDTTRNFAKGLIDVTVRDLGRVLAPELPPEWKKDISAASPGQATPLHVTERGVEFIGICSTREVSDDRVAQMVFQNEKAGDTEADALSKKYMADLRKSATIVKR